MDDDNLDELLDEIEAKYVNKANSARPSKNDLSMAAERTVSERSSHSKSEHHFASNSRDDCFTSQKRKDELSELIDDICDMPEPPEFHQSSVNSCEASNQIQNAAKGKSKCFPVYLSGTNTSLGLSTAAQPRACDRLRCTDCDFKVTMFEDLKWHSTTDYLFLRNNIPDFERLKCKLNPTAGWRAYACQCKFKNINKIVDLSTVRDLKWVCGKH